MQLCAGHRVGQPLLEKIVEVIAEARRLREENARLREHAELKVIRAGDFLRAALSIIEAGEEQYRTPEVPEAPEAAERDG
jgi:hypothetical protein